MASQREKKYKRLMEKARELFTALGYRGVSMDEIAATAGISKMTIYNHFPSKEALFMEVIKQIVNKEVEILNSNFNEINSTVGKIEHIFSYTSRISKDYSAAFYKDIMELPHIYEKIKEYKRQKVLVLWQNIIQEGIDKGEIRPLDQEFISMLLMDLAEVVYKPRYISDERGLEWLIENLFDFLRYGLLGTGQNELKRDEHK